MAFPFSRAAIASSLAFTLLLSFPPTTLSQTPPLTPDPPATMAACAPRLLPLSPCAAFVQGVARVPLQACCDNLAQLNSDQPDCLCLLFTNSSSFPVNTSLAMRLPALCNVRVNTSICAGFPGMDDDGSPDPSLRRRRSPPRRSPPRGRRPDDPPTGADPPTVVVQVAPIPTPSRSGSGSGSSSGGLALLMTLAAITFTKLTCLVSY